MNKNQITALAALAILAALALYLKNNTNVQISLVNSKASPYNTGSYEKVNAGMNALMGKNKKHLTLPDAVSQDNNVSITRNENKFVPGMYENVSSHETFKQDKALVAAVDQNNRLVEVTVEGASGDRQLIKAPGDRNDLL